jgi:hypothetical protein
VVPEHRGRWPQLAGLLAKRCMIGQGSAALDVFSTTTLPAPLLVPTPSCTHHAGGLKPYCLRTTCSCAGHHWGRLLPGPACSAQAPAGAHASRAPRQCASPRSTCNEAVPLQEALALQPHLDLKDALAAQDVVGLLGEQVPHEHVEAVLIQGPRCDDAHRPYPRQVVHLLVLALGLPLALLPRDPWRQLMPGWTGHAVMRWQPQLGPEMCGSCDGCRGHEGTICNWRKRLYLAVEGLSCWLAAAVLF